MTPRLGSLFTGYGGLDIAAAAFYGASTAWVSDIDKGACKILAHRYPDVPNIGDITTVDWSALEPVDILTGGFPCQDLSHAGKRAGLRPDTRSGLWTHMAYAVSILRPRIVVAENVRGLLSAAAHSSLEPCAWCVGGAGDGEPDLRALGAVLGDLADLGYDAQWVGLRAADVGAPHGRFRVFIIATDTRSMGGREGAIGGVGGGEAFGSKAGHLADISSTPYAAPHTNRATRSERGIAAPGQAEGGRSRTDAGRRGGASTGPIQYGVDGCICHIGGMGRRSDCSVHAPADADRFGRDGVAQLHAPAATGVDREDRGHLDRRGDRSRRCPSASATSWGDYEPAIRRWEQRLGRVAPAPTETSPKGSQRLSPAFVEWMMGLPEGHVTAVPELTRNEQLKALGNGVVPQQAFAALQTHRMRTPLPSWQEQRR